MGILNVTPDSFSDGGSYTDIECAKARIAEMIQNGADIIDIGGESTRPGAETISASEEIQRVLPVLEAALKQFPKTVFSTDTRKYEVAKEALETGTHLINDVSGLQYNPDIAELCATFNAGLIIMHSKGEPATMQNQPRYEDLLGEVREFLKNQSDFARKKGVKHIIIDPGFGFGKTTAHNLELTAKLASFRKLGYPVLMGASRKSSISEIVKQPDAKKRLAGTLAIHYHALMQGASILRVHDVKEANDSILVYNALKQHG